MEVKYEDIELLRNIIYISINVTLKFLLALIIMEHAFTSASISRTALNMLWVKDPIGVAKY